MDSHELNSKLETRGRCDESTADDGAPCEIGGEHQDHWAASIVADFVII